jgi:DNA-binding transcriptional regulator LsrR (DeoR family)
MSKARPKYTRRRQRIAAKLAILKLEHKISHRDIANAIGMTDNEFSHTLKGGFINQEVLNDKLKRIEDYLGADRG